MRKNQTKVRSEVWASSGCKGSAGSKGSTGPGGAEVLSRRPRWLVRSTGAGIVKVPTNLHSNG